jgi:hypothetical protein
VVESISRTQSPMPPGILAFQQALDVTQTQCLGRDSAIPGRVNVLANR